MFDLRLQVSSHEVPLVPAGSLRQAADLGSGQPLHRRRLPRHVLWTRTLPAELLCVSSRSLTFPFLLRFSFATYEHSQQQRKETIPQNNNIFHFSRFC